MATRIGAFKAKTSQLVIWQTPDQITFTFQKCYRDKRSGQWKETKTIFSDELQNIADMFTRAAEWARKRDCGQTLPKGFIHIDNVADTILTKIKERYETNSHD
jgi:hypothetical protein